MHESTRIEILSPGKSTAWRVLLTALNRIENSDGQAHIIDPKAISKDDLYGYMDQNTREHCSGIPRLTIGGRL